MSIERSREGDHQTEQRPERPGSWEQMELFNLAQLAETDSNRVAARPSRMPTEGDVKALHRPDEQAGPFNPVRAEVATERAANNQHESPIEPGEESRKFPEGSEPGRLNAWLGWDVLIRQGGFDAEPPEVTGPIRYRKDKDDKRSLDREGVENEGFTWIAVDEIFPIHHLPKQKAIDQAYDQASKAIDQAPDEAPHPIINLANRILEHGYYLYPDDIDIEGKREPPITVSKRSNGDWVCEGGQHRIAALAMLGEKEVPVKMGEDDLAKVRAKLMGDLSRLYPSGEKIEELRSTLTPEDRKKFDRTAGYQTIEGIWTSREAWRLYQHWQMQGMEAIPDPKVIENMQRNGLPEEEVKARGQPDQKMIEHMQRVGLPALAIEDWRKKWPEQTEKHMERNGFSEHEVQAWREMIAYMRESGLPASVMEGWRADRREEQLQQAQGGRGFPENTIRAWQREVHRGNV